MKIVTPGTFSRCDASTTVAAQMGSSPTMERTFRRWAWPFGNWSTS